ncbi:hypothetical protein OAE89_01885 [Crocinitomicaceae bacterium]|jgi:hypothetical protein|nr:hypothetical protein [Crocinitomicaceae bacterium]
MKYLIVFLLIGLVGCGESDAEKEKKLINKFKALTKELDYLNNSSSEWTEDSLLETVLYINSIPDIEEQIRKIDSIRNSWYAYKSRYDILIKESTRVNESYRNLTGKELVNQKLIDELAEKVLKKWKIDTTGGVVLLTNN